MTPAREHYQPQPLVRAPIDATRTGLKPVSDVRAENPQ